MTPRADAHDVEAAAAAWLERREWSEWDASTEREFEAWTAADTAHRIAFLRLQAAWERVDRLKELRAGIPSGSVPSRGELAFNFERTVESDRREAVSSITPSRSTRTGFLRAPFAWSIAAAVSMATLGLIAWFELAPHWQIFTSPAGTTTPVMLPDGSRLTLDSDTRLRVVYDPHHRTVRLDRGEAFFIVARSPSRPFTVEIADKRVVDLGTRFSVRRTADEIQVLVQEGRVRVEQRPGLDDRDKTAELEAGSEAQTHRGKMEISHPGLTEIERRLSWRDGYLAFQETPLSEVVAEFNRYLRTPMQIDDPGIASIRIGGRFRYSDPEAFLALLQQGFPVTVDHEADRVILRRR